MGYNEVTKKMSQYGKAHMSCQCHYCIGKGNNKKTRRGYKKAARRDGKKEISKQSSERQNDNL